MLGHDRGETRTRALAHLVRPQMEQVDNRKAAGTGRRPIHDADEPAVLDKEVSRPEVAVRKPPRHGCESVLQSTPQIAQRLRMLRKMLRTDLGVAGRRSRAPAIDLGHEELAEKIEAVSSYPFIQVCGRLPGQSPLDGPLSQPGTAAREDPRHTLRDESTGVCPTQRVEHGSLVLDPPGCRPERDSQYYVFGPSDEDPGAAENDRPHVEFPAEFSRGCCERGFESGRLRRPAPADHDGLAGKPLEERDAAWCADEAREERRIRLPGNRDRPDIAEAECRPAGGGRPAADQRGIGEATRRAEQPGPTGPRPLDPDGHDCEARVADELTCRGDLDIRRRVHELAAPRRDHRGKLAIPDPEAARSHRDDRREPTEPGTRPDTVPTVVHRFEDASTPSGALPNVSGADALPPVAEDRLGIYLDDVYRVVETGGQRRVSTDRSFLLFVIEVGRDFDGLVVFGRAVCSTEDAEYILQEHVELAELPNYSSLRRFFEVLPAVAGTTRAFWRGLDRVDTLWVFGPHPFAALLAVMAALRRRRVVLGVRQHSVRLYEARVSGWRRLPSLAAVRALDGIFRLLARRMKVTVQGAELARHYGAGRNDVLPMTESIVRSAELAGPHPTRDWSGSIELLTVGRLETEKNPLLLVNALARLEAERPGRYRLTWVGRGPLEDEVRRRARELGLERVIEWHGYVPFDAGLLDLYRRGHIFVHVSLSEGMPKVLIEALACGTAIVGTDVGGVRDALDDGQAGLLVPPDELEALVDAIRRITDDPALRDRLVTRGRELARDLTLEAQAERVVRFIRSNRDVQ